MLSAVGLTTHIYNNHVKSVLLLAGFPVLLLSMLGGFCALMSLAAQPPGVRDWTMALQAAESGVLSYGHYAVAGAAVWMVIAYFFHGSMLRMATRSHPVTRAEMPDVYNMLENLCIARGITVPQFEIIDTPALNAYASGINDNTYTIVLTTGLIDALSPDELEAVIAHELTHIVNRDVRLLVISVIFVGMISFFAELAFRSLYYGGLRIGGNGKGRGGQMLVMLAALLILAIGYVLALLIRFALSRKREYLADAGAVEMTKNPDAMMRALTKISGRDRMPGMPDEVEQMCIENRRPFMGIFATHPPIDDRIAAISRMTDTPVPQFFPASETSFQKRESPWT